MPGMQTFCLGVRRPETPTPLHQSPQTIGKPILGSANGLKDGVLSSSDGEATEFATTTDPSVDHGVPRGGMSIAQALDMDVTGSKLDKLKRLCRYICFQTVRLTEALKSSASHTPATQQLEVDIDGLAEPADAHEPSMANPRSWAELIPDLAIEAPEATPNKSLDRRSGRETAVRKIDNVGFGCRKASTSPWSPLQVYKQPEEQVARPSDTAQPLPVSDTSQPVFTEQTRSQGDLDTDRPTLHTLEVANSQQPQRTSSHLEDVVHLPQPCEFKTTFRMVIHLADNHVAQRVGKLDTASKVDVISKQVVTSLGLAMGPYNGPIIAPLGPPIHPVGEIQIDWHVAGRCKTYTTNFAVLDESLTKDFDALLSVDTIKEVGFYKVDNTVWLADVEVVAPSCL